MYNTFRILSLWSDGKLVRSLDFSVRRLDETLEPSGVLHGPFIGRVIFLVINNDLSDNHSNIWWMWADKTNSAQNDVYMTAERAGKNRIITN